MLSDSSIKERHWKQVEELLQTHLPRDDFYMSQIINTKVSILDVYEDIEDISDTALKQQKIERYMGELEQNFDGLSVVASVRKLDERIGWTHEHYKILETLEENFMATLSMQSHKAALFFEEQILSIQKRSIRSAEYLLLYKRVDGLFSALKQKMDQLPKFHPLLSEI